MALLLLLLQETGTLELRVAVKTEAPHGRVRVQTPPHRASMPLLNGRWPFGDKKAGILAWDELRGIRADIADARPGLRFVYAAWEDVAPTHYLDGRWVELKKGETTSLNLRLEPALSGDAEIVPAPGVPAPTLAFLPADAAGRVPDWTQRGEGPAFTETLRNGKALFRGMRPGAYVFYSPTEHPDRPAPTVTALVEIQAGKTVKATLGGPRE